MVMRKTNEALEQGLYHLRRHRASSQGDLESPGRKVSSAGFHAPENLVRKRERERERERKRERERRTRGPKSLVEQECFIELCVSIYTVLQGSFFSKDKDQKARLTSYQGNKE